MLCAGIVAASVYNANPWAQMKKRLTALDFVPSREPRRSAGRQSAQEQTDFLMNWIAPDQKPAQN